ncbi:putative peptidoglycan muropeptide transporter SLC46 [Trichinella pseudospiralis]
MAPAKSSMKTIKWLISEVTVEPITFLNFLALAYYSVPMQVGIYKVICEEILPGVDCNRLSSNPEYEDKVQRATSIWAQVLIASYLLPALFSDTIMGAIGDMYGRQINILIGIAGMMLSWYSTAVVLSYPGASLIIILAFNFVAGATGFLTIVAISAFAYLSDVEPDHENLTIRMVILSMINAVASVIGSLTAAVAICSLSEAGVILISLILLAFAFFYTLLRIKQIPPTEMRRLIEQQNRKLKNVEPPGQQIELKKRPDEPTEAVVHAQSNSEKTTCLKQARLVMATVKKLLLDVYRTYTKPRAGHKRMYVWIASLVYFLQVIVDMGLQQSVLSLYLLRRPFNWSPEEISVFRGISAAINAFGSVVGIVVLKKLLKCEDVTILIIALASCIVDRTFTAFSTQNWMIYTSVTCGCLSTLLVPTMKSFTAKLVAHDEVGKIFTAFGLGSDLAHLLSAVLLNSIYTATVSFFPGSVFLFGASLSFIGLVLFCFVWFELKRNSSLATRD